MSALPLTTDDIDALFTHVPDGATARAGRQGAPLRLAPPAPGQRPATNFAAPGSDLVPVDPRARAQARSWIERYAQMTLEIVAGERPASQLVRWTRTDVHQDLTRRAQLALRASGSVPPHVARTTAGHPRPQVQSARLSFLDDTVVEASVHVRHGERSRALAARFEFMRQRWVCTALEFC